MIPEDWEAAIRRGIYRGFDVRYSPAGWCIAMRNLRNGDWHFLPDKDENWRDVPSLSIARSYVDELLSEGSACGSHAMTRADHAERMRTMDEVAHFDAERFAKMMGISIEEYLRREAEGYEV